LGWSPGEIAAPNIYYSIKATSLQISDHPATINGSIHKVSVVADFGATSKKLMIPIKVVRTATKMDRETVFRANMEFNMVNLNGSALIYEKG
jgi:hypothetical protein